MINFSSYSSSPEDSCPSEIIGADISTRQVKLPRHISAWETKSHRNLEKLNRIKQASFTCRLDARKSKATNLAVNILRYQLRDSSSRQKHLENVQCNLERRLAVAQATGNKQLISILQEEFKNLKAEV